MWIPVEKNEQFIYDIFEVALDLEEPWKLMNLEFDEEAQTWHLYIDFKRGATFPCPLCGSACKVYDTSNKNWRHLDFWDWKTYLHARVPRVNCHDCSKVTTIPVSWSRPKSHFTLHFESLAMRLMADMPVLAAARELREHDTRLWRIFHHYIQEAMDQVDLSMVKRIAIDETSSRRGHRYITLFVDVDRRIVLFATEGKGAETLDQFRHHLQDKDVDPKQIEEICCDMSPAYIKGIEERFPEAHITFDKFHVMKLMNDAVDEVRREEQKEVPELKKTRYIWLKNEQKLSKSQTETLHGLQELYLHTGRAYRLKLALQDFWNQRHIFADLYLEKWLGWANRSQLSPVIQVAKTLRKHAEGILRWFFTKMTNGLLEGINGLVQAAKRKARGYRNVTNLIHMVYMTANKHHLPKLSVKRA